MNNFLFFCKKNLRCNKNLMTSFLCAIYLIFNCPTLLSQNLGSGWVYIENVQTNLVLDVQGNAKTKGTTIWPHSLNYSKAQMFKLTSSNIPDRFGNDARYIMAYDNRSLSSDFYLSVKVPPLVTSPVQPIENNLHQPALSSEPMVFTDGENHSNRKTLNNYEFTIEEKNELSVSPIHLANSLATKAKQIWKIIPVPNEPDMYYIQSAEFKKQYVIEPLGLNSGGTLVLGEFTGSNLQKWKILKTAPNEPTDIKLTNFEWERDLDQSTWKFWKWHYAYKIKGDITWKRNNDVTKLSKQRLTIGVDNDNEHITIEPQKSSYKFSIESNSTGNKKEHCFRVKAYSKWSAENTTFSVETCTTPNTSTPPKRPPSKGVSKLLITNCHDSKTESVRLWLYDVTTNNGNWVDKGVLNNQWQGSNCPSGIPKEINLTDNHVYILKAIDCGNLSPNETNGSCHVLTSPEIKGAQDGNGTTLSFQIDGS
ncbi:hypothetical protein ACFFU1_08215 [Algibacter miyuki]|uniref:Ricin B lectin domain-containing protein n=1 Tax=Algibacter miyuki TaxID=1306933 RepID=A0ABV5GZI2_9FLAO|nr:RICIN domain-containing protein [Algibacter miyuki]MDN3666922.1 RICIN domain-containing protein [Algibacter miyuki]